MNPKAKRRQKRMHLSKRIAKEPELSGKMAIALLGKKPCPLENSARSFLEMERAFNEMNASEAMRDEIRRYICEGLFSAVCEVLHNRDSQSLRDLASFLDKKTSREPADPLRTKLLLAKYAHRDRSPITPKDLAERLHYTGDMDVFRRTANEVEFPLLKSKGGRPKENSD